MHQQYMTWGPTGMFGTSELGFGIFAVLAALWLIVVIALKGYSLWHAAKRGEKWWFIALLLLNTGGILELVYIIFFLKKWPKRKAQKHEHHDHTTKAF